MYIKDLVQSHTDLVHAALVSVSSYEFCSCWLRGTYVFLSLVSSMPSGSYSLFSLLQSSLGCSISFLSWHSTEKNHIGILISSCFVYLDVHGSVSVHFHQCYIIVTRTIWASCSRLPLAQFCFILSSESESHYFLLTTIGCGVISKLNHVQWILIFLLINNLKL